MQANSSTQGRCQNNCSVMFLSELYVCKDPDCYSPQIRCRDCFRFFHSHFDQTSGSKKIHAYDKFDQSLLFRSFLQLVRICQAVDRRLKKSLSSFLVDTSLVGDFAIASGKQFQSIFGSQGLMKEFFNFRNLYFKQAVSFQESPSSEFAAKLAVFTEKTYQRIIQSLLKPSFEETILEYSINQVCGNLPSEVEQFISIQQDIFNNHCISLQQKGESLQIVAYLRERRKDQTRNHIYYCRDFENFLENMYEDKPGEKAVFTLSEYNLYMWANIDSYFQDPNVREFFNSWAEAYQFYSKSFEEAGEEESITLFRLWKHQNYPWRGVTLKNAYFLESFIIGYIQFRIFHHNFGIVGEKAISWQEFGEYLRDYTEVVVLKNQEYVNMLDYREYFTFRQDQVSKFLTHIRSSPQIIFNRVLAIQYINKVFKEDGKISLKNYKKFIIAKQEEENERILQASKIAESLRKDLQTKEGERFYLTVFNAFILEAAEERIEINEQNYFLFKEKVLQKFDQKAIRMENQQLELVDQENSVLSPALVSPDGKTKIFQSINDVEQNLIEAEESESSEEDENLESATCLCCKGSPEQCGAPECEMMGYCVTCSL